MPGGEQQQRSWSARGLGLESPVTRKSAARRTRKDGPGPWRTVTRKIATLACAPRSASERGDGAASEPQDSFVWSKSCSAVTTSRKRSA